MFLLCRLSLWTRTKRDSWRPAWWTTASTLLRSASAELCPAPALTACVPWSTTLTLCWSQTSGEFTEAKSRLQRNGDGVSGWNEEDDRLKSPPSRSSSLSLSSYHSGRFCTISWDRVSLLRPFRTSSVTWAVLWFWCRVAYSRASSTRWASKAPRMPRLLSW